MTGFGWRRASQLTMGLQAIRNPGYDADRGPLRAASVRWHIDY